MRPLLWLAELWHRLTARRLTRRMFRRDGHLTPQAQRSLSGAAKRKTP